MNKEDVYKFLFNNPVMSAAINGNSYLVSTVLLFHIEEDLTMYFATKTHSYKAHALARDNRLSYSVWRPQAMMVQATGTVQIVKDDAKKVWVLDHLAESVERVGDFWPPVLQIAEGDYVIYKFTPSWVRVLKLDQPTIKANAESEMFEEIAL